MEFTLVFIGFLAGMWAALALSKCIAKEVAKAVYEAMQKHEVEPEEDEDSWWRGE